MDGLGPTGGQPAVTPSTTGGPLEASQSLTAHTHVRDLDHGINGVLPRAMTDRLAQPWRSPGWDSREGAPPITLQVLVVDAK